MSRNFLIKNTPSGLVLDATDAQVKIQALSGLTTQSWTMATTVDGKFLLTNVGNGKVLDTEGEVLESNIPLVTTVANGSPSQLWSFNADSTIRSNNSQDNLVVDITGGYLDAGVGVEIYYHHGEESQQFNLEYL